MRNALLVALMLAFASVAPAFAEPSVTPPVEEGKAPDIASEAAPDSDNMPSFGDNDASLAPGSPSTQRYVAEIVDSMFVVGPAEFFAIELPADPAGARAVHLMGTFAVTDKKGDIMIRLFRAPDYKAWLKKRGGDKAGAFWVSKRSKHVTVDQDLTLAGPFVVLLDNGYSMRTSKHVRAQMQIQYEWIGGHPIAATRDSSAVGSIQDDIITPRANTEEDIPPPPPPPPDEGSK
jgi:hypothetical protein